VERAQGAGVGASHPRRQLVCELRPLAFATARMSSEMAARMARIIGTTIIDEYLADHVRSGTCSSRWMMAGIASGDAVILSHRANPMGWNFREQNLGGTAR
jgi:hypothetical protein